MNKRTLFTFVLVAAALVLAGGSLLFRGRPVAAAPVVFAGSLHGGCYIAAPNICKIHVDPFTINVNDASNGRLVEFLLQANGATVYHFATSSQDDYKPIGDYTPSLVMEDFYAQCGQTYYLNLVAKDTTDLTQLNTAVTGEFTCPAAVP
ncbi:MAG: hypothetical protein L0Z70_16795 [Chloroflexi bacterium]|nr:hypothetical protein [Chloroflexota bacterium]